MAGIIKANAVQFGDSVTATNNFAWQTNNDGTATFGRGNVGALSQSIMTVDANGRVAMPQNVVAMSAFLGSGQQIFNNTYTKVQLTVKEFDTTNTFTHTGIFAWTPPVAGYYQMNGSYYLNAVSGSAQCSLYKNGAQYKNGAFSPANAQGAQSVVSSVVYMNGTTDYLELWCYHNNGSPITSGATLQLTYMNGILIAKA